MKKFPKTIQNQFKDLKDIQLSEDSKNLLKQQLLSELDFGVSKNNSSASFFAILALYFQEAIRRISLKPLGMVILVAGIIVGPGIATVSAARSSLPGDTLYPLKRSLETVELSFAFTEKKKATKEVGQIANRLTELNRITQEQTPSPERQQKIVLALEELKKNTDTVKKRLDSTKEENTSDNSSDDALEIARIIEEKTASYKQDLKTSVEQLGHEVAQDSEDIQLALSAVQEVAINALNIIAVNHEDGGEEVSKEDLKKSVQAQLATVKEQVNGFTKRLEDVELITKQIEENSLVSIEATLVEESKDDDTTEDDSSNDSDSTEEPSTTKEQDLLVTMRGSLETKIQEQISFIEELIELGEFKTALDRLSETKTEIDVLSQNLRLERKNRQAKLDALIELNKKEASEKVDQEEPKEEMQEEDDSNSTEKVLEELIEVKKE